jgi:hypothetical protein
MSACGRDRWKTSSSCFPESGFASAPSASSPAPDTDEDIEEFVRIRGQGLLDEACQKTADLLESAPYE